MGIQAGTGDHKGPHLHTSGRHTVIGTDRGVTDSMVVGYGGGVRRCECASERVCEDMVTNGNVSHLLSLFLALTEKNQ